jgi:hypothetical protein
MGKKTLKASLLIRGSITRICKELKKLNSRAGMQLSDSPLPSIPKSLYSISNTKNRKYKNLNTKCTNNPIDR